MFFSSNPSLPTIYFPTETLQAGWILKTTPNLVDVYKRGISPHTAISLSAESGDLFLVLAESEPAGTRLMHLKSKQCFFERGLKPSSFGARMSYSSGMVYHGSYIDYKFELENSRFEEVFIDFYIPVACPFQLVAT